MFHILILHIIIVGWVYPVRYHQWKSLCYIIYIFFCFFNIFVPPLKTKWGVCIVILIEMSLIQLFRERNYAKAFLTRFWHVKSREFIFVVSEWMNEESILKWKYFMSLCVRVNNVWCDEKKIKIKRFCHSGPR